MPYGAKNIFALRRLCYLFLGIGASVSTLSLLLLQVHQLENHCIILFVVMLGLLLQLSMVLRHLGGQRIMVFLVTCQHCLERVTVLVDQFDKLVQHRIHVSVEVGRVKLVVLAQLFTLADSSACVATCSTRSGMRPTLRALASCVYTSHQLWESHLFELTYALETTCKHSSFEGSVDRAGYRCIRNGANAVQTRSSSEDVC